MRYQPQTKNFTPSQDLTQNSAAAAFLASSLMPKPSVVTDSSWYMDSGASHHPTSDASNLSPVAPFHGTEQVMVGDGKTICIANIGNCSLHTHTKPLLLNPVLHTPKISKNLI